MGRNKYSQKEINEIKRLLALKNKANRFGQKQIRHELRTTYEFNISDFNEPGKAFGPDELDEAVHRHAILILDEATIANMLANVPATVNATDNWLKLKPKLLPKTMLPIGKKH